MIFNGFMSYVIGNYVLEQKIYVGQFLSSMYYLVYEILNLAEDKEIRSVCAHECSSACTGLLQRKLEMTMHTHRINKMAVINP